MTRTTMGGWVAGGAAALLAAGLALAPALAQSGGRWLHVRVVDGSEKAASVKVNLPVSVLETMAQAIEDDHFRDGKIEIGHDGIDAAQLQDLWKAIRASQDMEFVTVESDDATVKVAKSASTCSRGGRPRRRRREGGRQDRSTWSTPSCRRPRASST
jgi:hypothetical protein